MSSSTMFYYYNYCNYINITYFMIEKCVIVNAPLPAQPLLWDKFSGIISFLLTLRLSRENRLQISCHGLTPNRAARCLLRQNEGTTYRMFTFVIRIRAFI